MRFGGVILTGGRSRRMGRPKESLPIFGTTMLAWQCRTLLSCAAPVVVVARDAGQALPALPEHAALDVVIDDAPGGGPLAAIATALRHLTERRGFTPDDAAFVTACDQPFVTADVVRWLRERLDAFDVVMPQADGRMQPTASVLRMRALPHALALLAAGTRTPRSLATAAATNVIDEAALRTVDPELRCLRNLNAPADVERWRADMD